ncbi:MAG: ABC transporter substrate-binding protein [Candidatus Hodarchaeota archaeon]
MAQVPVIPRNEIVWATGYDTRAANFMPYCWDIPYGVAFMYEPLFGYDYYKDTLIPVIGTSYSWAPDGTYLHVTLNPNAKWSDGEDLDVDDVLYTFYLTNQTDRYGWDQAERIKNMTKIDAHTFRIYVNSPYEYSESVEDMLRTMVVILPEHVWKKIVQHEWGGDPTIYAYGLYDWGNPIYSGINYWDPDPAWSNWFDPAFNESYRVCSGPYEPYYQTATKNEEVYIRRDDWWGKGILYTDLPDSEGIPYPKYIGLRVYDTNTGAEAAIITGAVDLSSSFIDGFSEIKPLNPNLGTYFNSSPYYLSLSSVIEASFNHRRYPFVEEWLREAMAWALDYDAINLFASGGYWRRAKQGWIDNESYTHQAAGVYNDTIQQMYGISYNRTKALEILNTYCYQKGGWWYIKNNTQKYWRLDGFVDHDLAEPGNQTKLGGWEILVCAGWSDVIKAAEAWALYWSNISIPCVKLEVDFGSVYMPSVDLFDFDIELNTVNPTILSKPLTVFGGKRGTHAWWGNASGWENAEYESLYWQYETANATQKIAIASRMQEILADVMPAIPTHVNGYWYTFSTQYWEGWITEDHNYQQISTVFDVSNVALKQRLILNLVPSKVAPAPFIIPWAGLMLFTSIGLISVVVVVRRRIKK